MGEIRTNLSTLIAQLAGAYRRGIEWEVVAEDLVNDAGFRL
jgi:hypothetical protein